MAVDLYAQGAGMGGVDFYAKPEAGVDFYAGGLQEEKTYAGAAAAHTVQGVREGVGGLMRAAGDVLAPQEQTWDDIGTRMAGRLAGEVSPLGKVTGVVEELANGVRRKMTRTVIPEDSGVAEFGRNLAGAGGELGADARAKMREATPEDLNMVQEAGLSVISSSAQMVPLVVGARLGAVSPGMATGLALGSFGAQSFGQTYSEARAQGAEPEQAFKAALLSGGAEVMGEKLGIDTLLKGGKGWFKKYLLQEIGGEEFTTLAQSLGEKGYYNPEKWSDAGEIAHDLAVTALAAAGGAGVVKGVDMGLERIVRQRDERGADSEAARAALERELQDRLRAAAGMPELSPEEESPVPVVSSELTAEEAALAELQREQLRGGLAGIEPTQDGALYGETVRRQLGLASDGVLGQGRALEELPVEDIGGMTPEVLARRERTAEQGLLPINKRAITISAGDQSVLGLTLEQTGELPAGAVVAVGENADLFPGEVYQPVLATLGEWVAEVMPNARVVLNLEQLPGGAYGNTSTVVNPKTGNMTHVITVRELPSFKYQSGDVKTKMAMLTALSHEFGHALTTQNFLAGFASAGPEVLAGLREQLASGRINSAFLKSLNEIAPEETALIREWYRLRQAVVHGKMTAKEFVEQWSGMRKLGDSVNPLMGVRNKTLYSWATKRLGDVGKTLEGSTALELIEAQDDGGVGYWLAFDEFMAEQFSRAAYSTGMMERSALGRFFATTLQALRNLFVMLKKEKVVQPGEKFQDWLEKQKRTAAAMEKPDGKFKLSRKIKAAQKKILEDAGLVKAKKGKEKKGSPPPKEETSSRVDEKTDLLAMIDELTVEGKITEKVSDRLMDKVERGELVEVRATLQKLYGGAFNDDREYSSKVLERLPNKAKVLAETLRATMAQGDVKKAERAFWQKFLEAHPQGFTLEEARQALVDGAMPLDFVITGEMADYGAWVVHGTLGESLLTELSTPQSRVWTNKDMAASRVAMKHFAIPNYVMHSRFTDHNANRFIMEMQSDLFQNGEVGELAGAQDEMVMEELRLDVAMQADQVEYLKELLAEGNLEEVSREWGLTRHFWTGGLQWVEVTSLDQMAGLIPQLELQAEETRAKWEKALEFMRTYDRENEVFKGNAELMKADWAKRLIREELAQAVVDGKRKVYFPTAKTLALIEGWPEQVRSPGVAGLEFVNPLRELVTATGEVEVTNRDFRVQEADGTWSSYSLESVPPEVRRVYEQDMLGGKLVHHYGPYQIIYDRHRWDVTKELKAKYGAKEVELNGYSWLEVGLEDKSRVVSFWDRENPMQGESPSFVQAAFAGLGGVSTEEAVGLWERLRFESPLFKRWFGGSVVVTAGGEPLEVWRGLGGKVSFVLGGNQKAFWFSNNAGLEQIRAGKMEERAQPAVRGYYLRLENPLVVDFGGQRVEEGYLKGWVQQAVEGGRDGLVVKGGGYPLGGNLYAVFDPEQAVMNDGLERTDTMHWDRESEGQEAVRAAVGLAGKFWERGKLEGMNLWAQFADNLTQLQQVAASQPEDWNLQTFMRRVRASLRLKNNLQQPAEELVKDMGSIIGQSPERVKKLHTILREEWKTGEVQTTIQGYNLEGELVWGAEVGTGLEQQALVAEWRVEDTPRLREFFAKHGVDATTEEGKALLDLYKRTRELFMFQFNELGKTLKRRAGRTYATAPALQKSELIAINGLMAKLIFSPFVPQGNFGKYVLIVQKDRGPVEFGQQRYVTVFTKHFERKADFDRAYVEAMQKAGFGSGLRVKSRVLADQVGIPLQLPQELLERLETVGNFSEEDLNLLQDVMTSSKYDKIAARFEKMSKQLDGGNEDFVRVLADFAARNANYIWKTHYRYELRQSISAAKHRVREEEKDPITPARTKLETITRLRRNIALMEQALDYMMSPPNELQAMRGFITMVYLAFNVKTALMNASTLVNTWAAVTSEYGELKGNAEFAKTFKQMGELMLFKSKGGVLEGEQMNELLGVLDRAIKDGVVDQSYAYFLAAHANGSALLAATGGRANRLGHTIAETGMWLFQNMEKLNRTHSLLTVYKLERAKGARIEEAYTAAVEKTGLLQNSYDAANRPLLFRGKKAVLTMFMSYVQFMTWIMTGGYERAASKQAELLGRKTAPAWRGTTMKLWLVYLMLGGLMGVPFGRNLMDVVQWLWRKLGWGNAEADLRKELDGLMEYLGTDSNFAMHGLLHDLGGFDLSGSFGLGRIFPGTDMLTKERDMNTLEVIGSLATTASGPAGSFWKSVVEAVGYAGEGDLIGAGKSMPGAIGAVSKAADAYLRQQMKPTQGVTTKDGRRLTWDAETGEFRDLTTTELLGMALGANPTLLAENREKNFAVQSEVYYWQGRRADILDRYWQAYRSGDQELRLEVLAMKDKFNAQIPDPKLRITGAQLAESIRAHKKQVAAGERYGTNQKRMRGVAGEVGEAY